MITIRSNQKSDIRLGWLQLEEGDVVWVRDLDGTKRPEDDVIRFYSISSCVYAARIPQDDC